MTFNNMNLKLWKLYSPWYQKVHYKFSTHSLLETGQNCRQTSPNPVASHFSATNVNACKFHRHVARRGDAVKCCSR